ncbi:MAG TPA: 4a-hydroxytetrahydrobiopterin dehydratase [Opitutaceae bacterium]|nr:4a-hydroxytetrahydrobiopterin dehydratase [Opitutaceae bacterium]
MAKLLDEPQIGDALSTLPGWTHEGDALVKAFPFSNFREAISFMMRVSFECEEMNHHPVWTNVYDRVFVRLNTHDKGGKVTDLDVELARRIEKLSAR